MIALNLGWNCRRWRFTSVAAFNRRQCALHGGGPKYFILGALIVGHAATDGMSLIYGYSGNTDFDAICGGPERVANAQLGLVSASSS